MMNRHQQMMMMSMSSAQNKGIETEGESVVIGDDDNMMIISNPQFLMTESAPLTGQQNQDLGQQLSKLGSTKGRNGMHAQKSPPQQKSAFLTSKSSNNHAQNKQKTSDISKSKSPSGGNRGSIKKKKNDNSCEDNSQQIYSSSTIGGETLNLTIKNTRN